jgi:polyprenyl P-hydroxybenzoate/phenylacrylic acid decarboxylase-like protein
MKLIIGITGATGSVYAVRLLEVLTEKPDIETHLIMSDTAKQVLVYETGRKVAEIEKLATKVHNNADLAAGPASGTFRADGMIVIPCTAKTLSALAHSDSDNLMVRAGDVILKERRRLVAVFREAPLHLGHIRAMEQLTEIGGIILPPVPAFYNHPKTIDDIVNHTIGKVLDLFDIPHTLYKPWEGIEKGPRYPTI